MNEKYDEGVYISDKCNTNNFSTLANSYEKPMGIIFHEPFISDK